MLGIVVVIKKEGIYFRCKDESYAFLEANLSSFPVQQGDAVFFHGGLKEARTLTITDTIDVLTAQKALEETEATYLEPPDIFITGQESVDESLMDSAMESATEDAEQVDEISNKPTKPAVISSVLPQKPVSCSEPLVCKVYQLRAGTTPLFTILPSLRLLGSLLPIKRKTPYPMFYRAHFVRALLAFHDADIVSTWAKIDKMCVNALDNAIFSFRRTRNKILNIHLRVDEEMGFFRAWRDQKVMRSLRLLGLDPDEIAKCGLPLHAIPAVVTSTPHRVSGLNEEYIKRLECTITLKDTALLREDREVLKWLEETCAEKRCIGLTFREVAHRGKSTLASCSRMLGISVESAPSPNGNMMDTVLSPLRLFRISEKIADFVASQLSQLPVSSPLPCLFTRDDLDPLQKKAVQLAIDNNISAIVGSPGTGKTTIIKQIVTNLERWNTPVLLLTNNGIAAYRVQEAIGTRHCSTVQMYVNKLRNADALKEFKKVQHIVLDEASMLSSKTFVYLLDKMRQHGVCAKMTLIGDPGQLEAIDAGLFFEQLVQIGSTVNIPCVRLERVYRTDEDLIRSNCVAIAKGIPPLVTGPKFRIENGGLPRLFEIMKIFHASGRSVTDVVVLCPYVAPLNAINERVREIFGVSANVSRRDPGDARKKWYIGDKVRQTVNDHRRQCYNGSQGIVESFVDGDNDERSNGNGNGERNYGERNYGERNYGERSNGNGERNNGDKGNRSKILVRFATGILEYDFRYVAARTAKSDVEGGEYNTATGSLTDLEPAYAMSVHSAEGMEAPVVMLYIPPDKHASKRFLNSKIIYTGISRAKEMVLAFANSETLQKAAFMKPEVRPDPLMGLLQKKLKN